MKINRIYMLLLLLLVGCASSIQERNKNDNCNEKIKNFVDTKLNIVYGNEGKIDSSEMYIEYFSHQNMQIYDIKHFTKGRHAFNLICFDDSIYYNDNIFNTSNFYIKNRFIDISDKILGISHIFLTNDKIDSIFLREISLRMLSTYADMHYANYSYKEGFLKKNKLDKVLNILKEENINTQVLKDHQYLCLSDLFYVINFRENLYIYNMYKLSDCYYNQGVSINSSFFRIKLFIVSYENDTLQIPFLNEINIDNPVNIPVE